MSVALGRKAVWRLGLMVGTAALSTAPHHRALAMQLHGDLAIPSELIDYCPAEGDTINEETAAYLKTVPESVPESAHEPAPSTPFALPEAGTDSTDGTYGTDGTDGTDGPRQLSSDTPSPTATPTNEPTKSVNCPLYPSHALELGTDDTNFQLSIDLTDTTASPPAGVYTLSGYAFVSNTYDGEAGRRQQG